MTGKARGSPTTRGVKDVAGRVCRLEKFVSWGNVSPVSFEEMVPHEMWCDYWDQLTAILDAMRVAQEKAAVMRQHIMRFNQANEDANEPTTKLWDRTHHVNGPG
jgi:hypothetical protein